METIELIQSTKLPLIRKYWLYLQSIAVDCLHRAVHHRIRDRQQVNVDYDGGSWATALSKKRWNEVGCLEDYVIFGDAEYRNVMLDGEIVRIRARDYYSFKVNKLHQVVSQYASKSEPLVELGCGIGWNLFSLALKGDWKLLRGYELSSNGVQVVREVCERFKLTNIAVEQIDLLDFESQGYRDIRDETVFTFYCLEQLPSYTEQVIRNLAAAGVKRAIHIEPTPELFSAVSAKDLATITYIWRQNYLSDLVKVALALQTEGLIRILEIKRLNFAPSHRNDPTLVVWEPVAKNT